MKPDLYEAQLNLGIVLLRSKQPAEAAPIPGGGREAEAEGIPTRLSCRAGAARHRALRIERFLTFARRLRSTRMPKDAQAALAQALARTGKLDEAAPMFEKSGNLLELGDLYEKANRRAEAIEIYRKFPDNPAARERLGELLLEGGEAAKAIPELEASVAKSPTAANRYALAMAYVKNNEYSKAEPLLQSCCRAGAERSGVAHAACSGIPAAEESMRPQRTTS